PHRPCEMRALLASSSERRHHRHASGTLRPLRERGWRPCQCMKQLFVIALPIFALDQATKWWIIGRSGGVIGWQETILPDFFDLCYLANTGAAFSLFLGPQTIFFLLFFFFSM